MPALDSQRRTLQAKHAAAVRWDKPTKSETARELAAAKLEDYIRRVVDAAPPLTPAELDRLAMLLRGGAHGTQAGDRVAS